MRRLALALLLLGGCGGGATEVKDASSTAATQPASKADACIADANVALAGSSEELTRVTVKHVLVKHIDAVRAPDTISRSRGEACLRALQVLDALKSGTEFDDVVKEYSDEAGAATRGGMLGAIEREDVDPAFGAAAFSLEPDQVSNVVESKFGFHVILRAE
jgi:NIMA-interacting peptidyl-prolyl cis-trans isomerase 1